jgi:hypothetical protein
MRASSQAINLPFFQTFGEIFFVATSFPDIIFQGAERLVNAVVDPRKLNFENRLISRDMCPQL